MPERELMHWLMTVVLPIVISVGGVVAGLRSNIAKSEHRLTKIEAENAFQTKTIAEQNIRLNKHDEEQKTMMAMIEQIKNLSEDVKEVRTDLKKINEKLQEEHHAH